MNLIIEPNGGVRCVYGEEIALDRLGPMSIRRASHVEPDPQGCWLADLSPVGGPVLGPFNRRSEALEAEVAWLETNWGTISRCILLHGQSLPQFLRRQLEELPEAQGGELQAQQAVGRLVLAAAGPEAA
jgi:hypothetical protein